MACQPEVFVRSLEPEQGATAGQDHADDAGSGSAAPGGDRAGLGAGPRCGPDRTDVRRQRGYVREVIHAFNEVGFAALDPKWSGGRPRKFTPAARDLICQTARSTPSALGQPFTTWSLTKLVAYLAEHRRLLISTETVRRVLREAGISWQATKTWKASRDPDFAAKMARVLALYDDPPTDGRVICVDEFGPLNLQPRPGRGWFRRGQPARRRATYNRTAGVRQMSTCMRDQECDRRQLSGCARSRSSSTTHRRITPPLTTNAIAASTARSAPKKSTTVDQSLLPPSSTKINSREFCTAGGS